MFCTDRKRTQEEEDGRPSAAADVRAPLEAVKLQTGALAQLWLLLAAERREERELGGHDM